MINLPGLYQNDFEGSDYDARVDKIRLTGQIQRVFNCMKGGVWRSLAEIEAITGDPQSSISAQLRHLRKDKWGGFIVEKRRRGEMSGTWEYQLQVPQEPGEQLSVFRVERYL